MKQLRGKEVKKYFKTLPKRGHNIILILENIQYAEKTLDILPQIKEEGYHILGNRTI